MSKTKTFYLIDGHAQIFRAYYAPFNVLNAPSGEPVKATMLFTQMLLGILRDKKPDYLAMAMDVSDSSTQRAHLYPEYKANRETTPEDLHPQVDRIVEIVELMGIPIFRQSGYEADDLIATIATRLADEDLELVILSRDKDLFQLITDKVKLFDPAKNELIDRESLEKNHGYTPAEAVEIQTLTGDAVDNVPGIPGIGPKTALTLVKKYGTAEAVLAHADEQTPKLKQNLKTHGHILQVSRQLVTLCRSAPLELDLTQCVVKPLPAEKLRPVFERLSFRRLLEQLDDAAPKAPPPAARAPTPAAPGPARSKAKSADPAYTHLEFDFAATPPVDNPTTALAEAEVTAPGETTVETSPRADWSNLGMTSTTAGTYTLVDTEPALDDFVARLAQVKSFAVDTETTSLKPVDCDLVGLSFSWQAGTGYYLPLRSRCGRTLDVQRTVARLKPILEDARIKKCGQNIKFDIQSLRTEGIELAGVDFDSMVASYLLRPEARAHNMDALAIELLGHRTIPITDLIGRGKEQRSMLDVDTRILADYAGEDAEVTWRLREKLAPEIDASPMRALFHEVEMPLVQVLAAMEFAGIRLDTELLNATARGMRRRIEQLRGEIHRAAGREFTVDSPKQLAEVLFDDLHLRVVKKTKTSRSTDAEVLETLSVESAHPLPGLVLEYRELAKLCGTYVEPLPALVSPRTGRLHPGYHQTVAATGRLSSSDPNIQNIPIRSTEGREIRRAFVPRDDDHVLVTADYSQVELRILAHLSGDEALLKAFQEDQDIHAAVAAEVWAVPIDAVTREQRSQAKAINFGIIYGQGAFGLARSLGISQREASDFIAAYKLRYKGIVTFMDRCIREAEQTGRVLTLLGRQRAIPEIVSDNRMRRALGERLAINTVVQGTAADLIKVAMVRVHDRLRREQPGARLLIQVHDELVIEAPRPAAAATAALVREEMMGAMKLHVPLKVDVGWGTDWLEAKGE